MFWTWWRKLLLDLLFKNNGYKSFKKTKQLRLSRENQGNFTCYFIYLCFGLTICIATPLPQKRNEHELLFVRIVTTRRYSFWIIICNCNFSFNFSNSVSSSMLPIFYFLCDHHKTYINNTFSKKKTNFERIGDGLGEIHLDTNISD